jgi:hypothetical protein
VPLLREAVVRGLDVLGGGIGRDLQHFKWIHGSSRGHPGTDSQGACQSGA